MAGPDDHGRKVSQATHSLAQSFSPPEQGPSFSRFLSNSIVPLYKSRYFPSNKSEAPLFFSTREGYDVDLNDDEDIIPKEDDNRLKTGHSNGRSRGIDEEEDGSDSSRFLASAHGTVVQGKLRKQDQDFRNISRPEPPASSSGAHADENYADAGGEEDEDPFYAEDELSRGLPHQNIGHPSMQFPRHLMASHALSHLMASEIAYGNQQYQASSIHHQSVPNSVSAHRHRQEHQTTDDQQSEISNPSGRTPGWKMYQSIDPYRDNPTQVPPQIPPPTSSSDDSTGQPTPNPIIGRGASSIHLQSRPSHASDLTRTIMDVPNHPLVRPRPPERFAASHTHFHDVDQAQDDAAAYAISANAYLTDPIPYIYPSEARDIGSDVLGHPVLGPQNYRDSFWMAMWLGSLLYAFVQSIWVLLIPAASGTEKPGQAAPARQPNLLKSLPVLALLITLTFGFCIMSLSLLVMVKKSIKLLVYGSLVGVPWVLCMIGLWTWSESLSDASFTGMGWVSIATFLAASVLAKSIWNQRNRIDRTIKVLELSIGVVIEHPSLVLVCLATTITCIVMSLPFVTLVYKLMLLGSYDHTRWVIASGPIAQALLAAFIWSWTLNVIRNLQRIVISGVVSHWYFNRHSPPSSTHKGYSTIESTYSSINRATGPSLGTVCLASFLLTCFDTTRQILKWTNKFTSLKPSASHDGGQGMMRLLFCDNPVARLVLNNVPWVVAPIIGFGCRLFEFLTSYTIIYSGITGFSYWESSRRVTGLLNRNGQIGITHNLLVKLVLNLVSLTISLTLGLIGYTIVIGRRQAKDNHERENALEPLVFVLSGIMPFWILRFVTDLIADSVDTLLSFFLLPLLIVSGAFFGLRAYAYPLRFCCWNIDLDIGTNHSNKTEEAFTGRNVAHQAR